MSILPPARADEGAEARPADRIKGAIAAAVLRRLGRPTDLIRVAVVPLWANRYRVNVQTGADVVSTRIAHSFFLEANEAGEVVASDPAVVRVY